MELKITLWLSIAFVAFLAACSRNITGSGKLISFTGTVYQNGELLPAAAVSLLDASGNIKSSTNTNTNGYFEFSQIFNGEYRLKIIDENPDSSYVEMDTLLTLSDSLHIDRIELPQSIYLQDPHEVTDMTIAFRWSQFHSADFQEYRIYRVYETSTGTIAEKLLRSTPFQYDTTYRDNGRDISQLAAETTYGYRIEAIAAHRKSNSRSVYTQLNRWPNETNFQVFYELVSAEIYESPYNIQGIDFDGDGFWILAVQHIGSERDNNRFILVKYDLNLDKIVERFEYNDAFEDGHGIAWDGEYLWVQYGRELCNGREKKFTRKIDPKSGDIIHKYEISYGTNVTDIAYWQNSIYLGTSSHLIEKHHSAIWNTENLLFPFLTTANFGITIRPGEIWTLGKQFHNIISVDFQNHIVILDHNCNHIGVIDCSKVLPKLPDKPFLCFMNDKLVIADKNLICTFHIVE